MHMYSGRGTASHDTFECVEVQLWSTVVFKLSNGLAEPVESDADLPYANSHIVWLFGLELCDEVITCQLTLLILRSASFLFTLQHVSQCYPHNQ